MDYTIILKFGIFIFFVGYSLATFALILSDFLSKRESRTFVTNKTELMLTVCIFIIALDVILDYY